MHAFKFIIFLLVCVRYPFCLIWIQLNFHTHLFSSGSHSHFLTVFSINVLAMCLWIPKNSLKIYTIVYNMYIFLVKCYRLYSRVGLFLLLFSLMVALFKVCPSQHMLNSLWWWASTSCWRWVSLYTHLHRLVQAFFWDIHRIVGRRDMGEVLIDRSLDRL